MVQLFGFLTKFASGLRQNQLAKLGDSMAVIRGWVKPKDLFCRLIKFHSANIKYFNLHAVSRNRISARFLEMICKVNNELT